MTTESIGYARAEYVYAIPCRRDWHIVLNANRALQTLGFTKSWKDVERMANGIQIYIGTWCKGFEPVSSAKVNELAIERGQNG